MNGSDYSGRFAITIGSIAVALAVAAVSAYVVSTPAYREAASNVGQAAGRSITRTYDSGLDILRSYQKPSTRAEAKPQAKAQPRRKSSKCGADCGIYTFIDTGAGNPANAGKTYIGKTVSFKRRQGQHGARVTPGSFQPYHMPIGSSSLAIRAAEQNRINAHLISLGGSPFGLKGGLLANRINSISQKNFGDYAQESTEFTLQ